MKIDKLYTLSQFVDFIDLHNPPIEKGNSDCYLAIRKYNNFLKQPLKKEMFVNEIRNTKPINNLGFAESDEKYHERLKEWQEAEKRVIFKKQEKYTVNFKNEIPIIFLNEHNKSIGLGTRICMLSELAYITNSELETQNIEL